MNAKFCLLLAALVLVAALASGNPFLSGHALRMPASAAPPAAQVPPSQPAVDLLPLSGSPRQASEATARRQPGAADACPDPALAQAVVRVLHLATGEPCWLLRDGRVLRRNPDARPGRPRLVPVADETLERQDDEAPR